MSPGVTLGVTTLIGLIVRYAVQEFDPSVSTITVTTARVNNRDIASLSVSKNFLERILEFVAESISIVAVIIPIGFPLCTIFNHYFASIRAGTKRMELKTKATLSMIPKYLIIGDSLACQLPDSSSHLRPLVRDTIYHLIKSRLKPKLIVEDSYDEARKLGIRIGLIGRDHHKLAVIKSVDLLKNITDSRGDIKPARVRHLLARMKIMSQATPADKSLLVYLIKHCESLPNENLAYLGYSFTDPEAMRLADCALTFEDCDDDDVKRAAHVILKTSTSSSSFTDVYLFLIVCLITSNITQSYALYQISASVSCCIYRFLSITVFQEQLISHAQFVLLINIQQVFAICALMTKWLSSLAQARLRTPAAELSHAATDELLQAKQRHHHKHQPAHLQQRSATSTSLGATQASGSENERDHDDVVVQMQQHHRQDDTLGSSTSLDELAGADDNDNDETGAIEHSHGSHRLHEMDKRNRRRSQARHTSRMVEPMNVSSRAHLQHLHKDEQPIHLSGVDLNLAVINSKIATDYKQTFHNSSLVDDVTYRLAKLHIAYQILVMIIIMIFGEFRSITKVSLCCLKFCLL